MVRLLTSEPEPKLVMNQRVIFSCNCSEERAARALALLETQEEKEGLHHDGAETDIRCEFCGRTYHMKAGKTDEYKKGGGTGKGGLH